MPVADYLHDCVQEYRELLDSGFDYHGRHYHVTIEAFICETYVEYAKQFLDYFVANSSLYYGNEFVVYGVHTLTHLPEDVIQFDCSLNDVLCLDFLLRITFKN